MASAITIKLDLSKVLKLDAAAQGRARDLLDLAARNIEGAAKQRAPVDTGALRASIHVERAGDFKRIIADGVEYGVYQEFGTSRLAARPFMTPAVEQERGPFLASWSELCK